MGEMKEISINIPNLGEAEETSIIEVNISVGDKVRIDDPLIVLESEKAAMEVPAEMEGEITELYVKEGDIVKEGEPFLKILSTSELKPDIKIEKTENEEKNNVAPLEKKNLLHKNKNINLQNINAGPAVRKYARELELNLNKIDGTGKNGRITKEDLKNYIHNSTTDQNLYEADEKALKEQGDYEIVSLSKIRSIGANNLHKSWITIPHVTHFEEISLTNYENQFKSKNISVLAFISQVVAISLGIDEHKILNSSLLKGGKVMKKNYVNLGIAVDTNDGLVVPVIKNANRLTALDIDQNIALLAEKARSKKLLQNDLTGATFTISSLGKIGGTGFTPIINPPEVGIIAISRTKKSPRYKDNEVVFENLLPISLSYDHRVINGVDAGKFLMKVKELAELMQADYIYKLKDG